LVAEVFYKLWMKYFPLSRENIEDKKAVSAIPPELNSEMATCC